MQKETNTNKKVSKNDKFLLHFTSSVINIVEYKTSKESFMPSERNQRIAAFRKVSGRLLWLTMPLLILFGVGGSIAWIIFVCKPLGATGLVEILSKVHDPSFFSIAFKTNLSIAAKLFCTIYGAIFLITLIYVLFHFHSVLECFFDGDIFNTKALTHARKAYKVNLWSIYFMLSIEVIAIIVTATTIKEGIGIQVGYLINNAVVDLVIVGFLSLLLWALEIGTNLNEEVELTI